MLEVCSDCYVKLLATASDVEHLMIALPETRYFEVSGECTICQRAA